MKTEIFTNKIKLKIAEKSDSKRIFELRTNPEVAKFINRDLNKNLSEIETFIENINSDFNNAMFFKIITLEENEIVGTICLWKINRDNKYAEIGYELFPEFQNKGLMSNAIKAILDFANDELGLEYIEAYTHKENLNSQKLLNKFGFEKINGKSDIKNPNNVIFGKSINKACI
ncbi:GNAT family N-acetyltransferase [Parapedobacter tibetensis]|uniref:GNAT family N-acetyltransferase n=1 Tax=Parapedobacter tibetensis TaxID=2972951 RepID=UPI00214D62CB|nr:GNAT family N-acetyltransferase [Parapedobacter tibetensis]